MVKKRTKRDTKESLEDSLKIAEYNYLKAQQNIEKLKPIIASIENDLIQELCRQHNDISTKLDLDLNSVYKNYLIAKDLLQAQEDYKNNYYSKIANIKFRMNRLERAKYITK